MMMKDDLLTCWLAPQVKNYVTCGQDQRQAEIQHYILITHMHYKNSFIFLPGYITKLPTSLMTSVEFSVGTRRLIWDL